MPSDVLPEFHLASYHDRDESALSIPVYVHPMDFDVVTFLPLKME